MKLLITIILVTLVTQVYSQLKCYECVDCEEIDTDKATSITCSASTPSTDSTTDTSTTDTTTTETTTTETTTTETTTTDPTTTLKESEEEIVDPPPETDENIKLMAQMQRNQPQVLPLMFRQRRATTEYRCYKVEVESGDDVKINRGCVEYTTSDGDTCKSIDGEEPKNCDLCNENECNSSSMVVSSLIAVMASILITLRLL